MTNPNALARLLIDFLNEGDDSAIREFADTLRADAADNCPQGAALNVAYLNELVAALALGGEAAADRVIDEAADRRDAERNPVAERDEAADDVRSYRGLRRLLTANAKRAAKASRDILDQVPN
jgi:hypothetical protein